METYGKILLVAMPAFLVLVLFEKAYGVWKGKDTVRNLDMVSSLSSGVTNVVKDVLGLSIGIISYSWMAEHWAVVHVTESWLVYIIAFLVLDFSGYWVHRIAHQYNFFWNNHIIPVSYTHLDVYKRQHGHDGTNRIPWRGHGYDFLCVGNRGTGQNRCLGCGNHVSK